MLRRDLRALPAQTVRTMVKDEVLALLAAAKLECVALMPGAKLELGDLLIQLELDVRGVFDDAEAIYPKEVISTAAQTAHRMGQYHDGPGNFGAGLPGIRQPGRGDPQFIPGEAGGDDSPDLRYPESEQHGR